MDGADILSRMIVCVNRNRYNIIRLTKGIEVKGYQKLIIIIMFNSNFIFRTKLNRSHQT